MDRAQKSEQVSGLAKTLSEASVVVVTRNLGMTVAQSTALREKMRDAGATFKVSKNRLAKHRHRRHDLSAGSATCSPVPSALATSIDPVAAAKIAVDFAKTNDKFEIVGGAMGDARSRCGGVKALASMPSLDELRAKIVGLVQAPATKIAQLVTAPAAKLARVFGAYAAKEAA